jgi:hypothetical protein
MERFIVIVPMSINQDIYFKEDGTHTKDPKEAMVVDSIDEGQEKCRFMTLYQPIYQPI